jgi:hypothetical protein
MDKIITSVTDIIPRIYPIIGKMRSTLHRWQDSVYLFEKEKEKGKEIEWWERLVDSPR